MDPVKRSLVLLSWSAALCGAAELTAVHSVYLLPMSHGMDQYLANRLTNEHVFRVVTDPKMADAVFTDRIGTAFEDKWAALNPPPAPAAPPAPATPPAAPKSDADQPQSGIAGFGDAANKLTNPATNSTLGRAKGTIFLVDPKSKQVLWSTYETPKSLSDSQLNRAASEVVSRLKRDLTPQ